MDAFGLAQEQAVHRNWVYIGIQKATVPATLHPVTGHSVIPHEPELFAKLRAQRDRC